MAGRDPMKGRHAVGGRMANPGKMRGGQPEPASNKVTGLSPNKNSMRRPFVPDAKDTSADAQTLIAEPPAPFKNRQTAAQMPAGTGARGAVPGLEPKNIYAGKSGSTVGARALPSDSPVGGGKPNQSSQIGGHLGWPPPKRKAGVNGSGYPSKRNASFYGE